MKKISVSSLRALVAFVFVCILLAVGAVPLKPALLAQASNVPSVDAIEMFWWGAEIGESWGNAWNHPGGNAVPDRLGISGDMLTATPPVTSWEGVKVFPGWRQVFFRTPDGRLFELRSPAHDAANQTAGEITKVPLSSAMEADGVTSWNDVEIITGNTHVFARTLDGSRLYAWGGNDLGQLGLGNTNPVTTPARVPALPGFSAYDWTGVEIMAGIEHTIALTPAGRLYGWGQNDRGQLKQGSFSASEPTPVNISFPTATFGMGAGSNWNDVEIFRLASSHLVRTPEGRLFGWGQANMGQLGQDSPALGIPAAVLAHRPYAVEIAPSPAMTERRGVNSLWENMDIITHVGINRTFARCQTTGYMFAWGQNDAGQAGVYPLGVVTPPTNPPSYHQVGTPTLVPFPDIIPTRPGVLQWNNVELIAGAGHCFARTPCGRLFVWGNNASGQLGAGLPTVASPSNNPRSPYPIEVPMTSAMEAAGMESWNDVTLVPGFVTNFALMRVPGIPLQKTVVAPEGTTIPTTISVQFAFEPRQIVLSDDPLRESRPVGEVPNIPNQTLTLYANDATTAGGTTTVTGLMNLRLLVTGTNFFQGETGAFVWEVYEIPNSSSINTSADPDTMIYDTARFQFRAYVDAHGTIVLAVHEMVQNAQGDWVLGDGKPNAMDFTNILRSRAIDANALEFTKTVTCENDMANLTTPFNFTLNLTAHELAPFPTPLSIPAQRVAADNTVTNVTITSLPHEFTLLDGERFVIPGIYAGTTWNVTETAHSQFRAGVSVVVGGNVVHTYTNNLPNQSLSSGDRLVHDVGRNAADFTNAHAWDVPTGLVINNIPFVIPLAALAMLGILLASRKRRLIEEMPMMH